MMPATLLCECNECGHSHGQRGGMQGKFSQKAYEDRDMWVTPERFARMKLEDALDLPAYRPGGIKRDKNWSRRMAFAPPEGFWSNLKVWNPRFLNWPHEFRGARWEACGLEANLLDYGFFEAWS